MSLQIETKILNPNATLPTQATEGSAGYDLYACLPEGVDAIEIGNQPTFIKTGIAMAIPEGYFGGVYARSGLSCKHGVRPCNCVGVIDSDYRGEIMVCLRNDTPNATYTIYHKDRIAQLIIQPYPKTELKMVFELTETGRGEGGYGSTGH